jgi:ubiquinone/menaquinone biosynthesis C-methylase UbiE
VRRPDFIARQSACPSGLLGRLIGRVMARETASVNEAALELLGVRPADHVLEVGFGHGATIARLAAVVSGGRVAGVDPSAEMCRMAARRNRRAVEGGRVALRQASAEALPYPDAAFDKVLAVHTVYFWPDLARPLRETARVLRPGGRVVLAHRTDAGAARDFPASVYRFHGDGAVREALEAAGLSDGGPLRRSFGHATISFHVARR